jgi:hypothetical protein
MPTSTPGAGGPPRTAVDWVDQAGLYERRSSGTRLAPEFRFASYRSAWLESVSFK